MKKLIVALSMVMAFGASAANYKEGVHYQVLKSESFNAPNSVVKIYSVNCPFCYKYELGVIPNMVKNLPEGMTYDAYHITTKPPFGKEKASVIAVAKTLGQDQYKKVKMAYYARYHDQKLKFDTAGEVIDFGINLLGISHSEFDAKLASDSVVALLKQWDQGVEIAKIQGIPALVVDGKYLINTKSITSLTMLDDLVAELAQK
ncbi:thiol:disulfide interchange protein DsbA/DsbL [Ferrimonas sp. SCSIO 43195]|nr:thiol:disulfide interchange protein DsbA/DsbL [Ferrimonas sp. SCSIO 43195]